MTLHSAVSFHERQLRLVFMYSRKCNVIWFKINSEPNAQMRSLTTDVASSVVCVCVCACVCVCLTVLLCWARG